MEDTKLPTVFRSPPMTGVLAMFAAIPWCCVLPAALSLSSLGGIVATRLFFTRFGWLLLPLSGVLLVRAVWLVEIKRRGQPWTRWVTRTTLAVAVALWIPRLSG